MNANSESKNWQQKLSRWLSGDATLRDEVHLKKMAQEDSFLADAMEGYQSMPEGRHTRKVTQIKARLRQKNERKKSIVWLKIAAIGAFLLVALLGLREYNRSIVKTDMMVQKEIPTPPTITAANPENQVLADENKELQAANELVIEKPVTEKKHKKTIAKTPQKNSPKVPINTPAATSKEMPPSNYSTMDGVSDTEQNDNFAQQTGGKDEMVRTEKLAELEEESVTKMSAMDENPTPPTSPLASTDIPSPLDEEAFDKAYKPVILSNDSMNFAEADDATSAESNTYIGRVVQGKVLSEGGEPLIGANVLITGTPAGTTTDFAGDFTLQLPTDYSTIDIQYIGYEDIRVDLQNQNNIQINMESHVNLEEVSITAAKNKAKKAEKRSRETADLKEENNVKATPKIGFGEFDKYIKENNQLSPAEINESTSTTVIVQFKVKKSGNLSDFKILQSGGTACDAEAIRLLKAGPKWTTVIDTVTSYSMECGE